MRISSIARGGKIPEHPPLYETLSDVYLQVIGFEKAREPFGKVGRYTGVINCFIRIARTEGIRGFYKGTSVAVLKVIVSVVSELQLNSIGIHSTLSMLAWLSLHTIKHCGIFENIITERFIFY